MSNAVHELIAKAKANDVAKKQQDAEQREWVSKLDSDCVCIDAAIDAMWGSDPETWAEHLKEISNIIDSRHWQEMIRIYQSHTRHVSEQIACQLLLDAHSMSIPTIRKHINEAKTSLKNTFSWQHLSNQFGSARANWAKAEMARLWPTMPEPSRPADPPPQLCSSHPTPEISPRPLRIPSDVARIRGALHDLLAVWEGDPVRAVSAVNAWDAFRRGFIDPNATGGEVYCSVDSSGLPDIDGLPRLIRDSTALNAEQRCAFGDLLDAHAQSGTGLIFGIDDTEASYAARTKHLHYDAPIRRFQTAIRTVLRLLDPPTASGGKENMLHADPNADLDADTIALDARLSDLPPPEPHKPEIPKWDRTTWIFTARGQSKQLRSNGKLVRLILDAFEQNKWTIQPVPITGPSSSADRKKAISKFLGTLPVEIRPDGTGKGMVWRWKSAS